MTGGGKEKVSLSGFSSLDSNYTETVTNDKKIEMRITRSILVETAIQAVLSGI